MLYSSWDGSLWQMRILHEHIERACQVSMSTISGICVQHSQLRNTMTNYENLFQSDC